MQSGLNAYRQTVGKAKRAAILAAARDVFLRNAFSGTGMAEVCREANVSTATLYKHFASKEELFLAVVEEAARVVANEFPAEPPGETIADVLCAACRQYLAMQFDNRMNALMRIVIAEVPANPVLARRVFEQVVERRRDRVAAIFDYLIGRGDLKPHDTTRSATFLGGMMKELFVWPALFDLNFAVPENADAQIRETIELFLARYGA